MNLCKPPIEGLKCVPLQLVGSFTGAIYIDLTAQPAPQISQLAAMYVDAQGYDPSVSIIVVFADTGYSVSIEGGNTLLFPVFTAANALPKFYVTTSLGFFSGPLNIFLLNQFIPEFGTAIFQKTIEYGTNTYPINTAGTTAQIKFPVDSAAVSATINLTTNKQTMIPSAVGFVPFPFIRGMQIYFTGQSGATTSIRYISIFGSSSTAVSNIPIWVFPVLITPTDQITKIIEVGEMANARPLLTTWNDYRINIDSVVDLVDKTAICNIQLSRGNG